MATLRLPLDAASVIKVDNESYRQSMRTWAAEARRRGRCERQECRQRWPAEVEVEDDDVVLGRTAGERRVRSAASSGGL